MLRLIVLLAALCGAGDALAQGSLLQGGPWAPGRAPMYVGQGNGQAVVQDSGPAGGGGIGVGLSELGITARGTGTAPYSGQGTGPFGTNACDFDAPITNATGYHFLCFSANAQSGGLIAYGAGGTASQLPLYMNVNGTSYQFPFVLSGVVGPPTTTVGDLAIWNNTSGTLLKDSNVLPNGTTATTQATSDSSTKVATTSFVQSLQSAFCSLVPNTCAFLFGYANVVWYGAVADTSTAHAAVSATAFASALASGQPAWVPFSSLGFNLATQTVAVSTGQSLVCQNYVTIYGQGQTNSVFYVSANGPPNVIIDGCKGQMGINGVNAPAGSTFIRFATSLSTVNGVVVRNIWCAFVQECVGDEGTNTASFITLQNIYTSSTYARQFHIASSNGFLNLSQLNCDFSNTALSGAVAWSCGEFDGATGIFSNDWLAATNAGTGNSYNSSVQAWVFKNDNVLTLNIIKADATIGDGCLFANVNNLTISQLNCGFNLGTQATIQGSAATTGISITNASPAVVSWTANGFFPEQAVYFTGSMPSGLTANVVYYVVGGASLTTNSFEVSATPGGSALNTSSSASGLSGFAASANVLINSATVYGGNANQASSKAGLVLNSVVNASVAGTQAFTLGGDAVQVTGASTNVTIQGNTATGNGGNWATVGANADHVRFVGGANLGNGGGLSNSGTDACVTSASGITSTCSVPLSTVGGLGTGVATAAADAINATGGFLTYGAAPIGGLTGFGTGVAAALADAANAAGGVIAPTAPLYSTTAPTISSGFGGGSPAILAPNGTASFRVTTGTASGSTGVIALPAAANGWNCMANDLTTHTTANAFVMQNASGSSTTAAQFTNYSDTMGTATWVSGDVISIQCLPL